MMGSRVGDVLASRKPFVAGQMARHPTTTYPDHQGVVEDGRGRVQTSSKVSKIAGMFQSGGGGGGAAGVVGSINNRGAADDDSASSACSHDGPQHATVVRTESHLARFNNARALFEKMGQGDTAAPSSTAAATAAQPRSANAKPTTTTTATTTAHTVSSKGESKSSETKTETKVSKFETKVETSKSEGKRITGPSARTTLTSQHLRRPPGGGGGGSSSSDERGGRVHRGASISPARSVGGTSSSSSRSASPSPARTTNGHAHHSDQETGLGGGVGTVGVGVGVLGYRRPGSASSRSHSTSSTESEPPRRWPPGKASSTSSKISSSSATIPDSNVSSRFHPSRPDSLKSDVTTYDLRRLKPEKPAKPEGLERRISAHEQHQELIARHKNWFQAFSKNRSPASSPVKPDSRPESPNKAEVRPCSPSKGEETRPISPSKSEWRSSQPSKSELRSGRPQASGDAKDEDEDGDVQEKEDTEELSKEEEVKTVDEQDAWSSVLQNRYGPRAKDLLSPRGRSEGETSADWRKERAVILSGECRTGQRHSSSEDETAGGPPVKGQYRVTEASRFEDTATLQSSWSPPPHYNQTETSSSQSTVVKTLKEEINIAETERTKSARHHHQHHPAIRENGNAHESGGVDVSEGGSGGLGVGGVTVENENVVSLVERKEKADLIVSESVVIKDSTKEKDIEKRQESLIKTDPSSAVHSSSSSSSSSSTSSVSKQREENRPKKQGSSKETSEEVNLKLKESISGHSVEEISSERRDFRQELEERRTKRQDDDRLVGKREEVIETRLRENVTESSRRREEVVERRRRDEIIERRKRDDSIENWREEVSEHRKRRDKREESVRGKEKSEDSRVELSYRERSEERIRQIRRGREARSRERREDTTDKSDIKTPSTTESEKSETESDRTKSDSESVVLLSSQVAAHHDDQVTTAATTHHRTETHSSTTYESRSFVSHAKIPTSSTTTEPTPPIATDLHQTLPVETVTTEEPQTTVTSADGVGEEVDTVVIGGEVVETVVIGGVLSALKAETVYVSSTEDLSQHDDSKKESKLDIYQVNLSEAGDIKEKTDDDKEKEEAKEEEKEEELPQDASVRRQLFSDVAPEWQHQGALDTEVQQQSDSDRYQANEAEFETSVKQPQVTKEEEPDVIETNVDAGRISPPPTSPQTQQSLAALDALIHGRAIEAVGLEPGAAPIPSPAAFDQHEEEEEEEEIVYDHTVTSAQHKIQFCTTPVTVEGITPDAQSHDTDPEPLPPPIPPHGIDPEVMTADEAQRLLSANIVESKVRETQSLLSDEEAQEVVLLLSPPEEDAAKVLPAPPPPVPPHHSDGHPCVPPHYDIPPAVPPHYTDMAPPVPPHYASTEPVPPHYASTEPVPSHYVSTEPVPPHFASTEAVLPQYTSNEPVPPHYVSTDSVPHHYAPTDMVSSHYPPNEDEFDTTVASHFDPTLASPLSPEDEPSEADSSEGSGDASHVSRVKEVLVEDGVHYLEDGHFWVEIPGLPEDDDEEDIDPMLPFHPHTKLSFSKDPIQVFSTYSVTEYDRKNDEVDPVAASAEYELEKRVEKMDLFPVEIIKGEGGLGLSIIGMGVGADAGVEKLGIFVKTITSGGATERDSRIQVNDQIIEVDGKSLVGVTQVFAASVLKNTSGRVHFLIGREKDPENSEVALLIKQSLQADREREERRRALGGPDYDPHTGHGIFETLSSPSDENSRSEEVSAPQNYSSYLEGGSSPTSPDAVSPPIESFDLEGDTSDTSPDNDVSILKLKLKEIHYRNAVAEAEITKLKMTLLDMEKIVTENVQFTSQLNDAQIRVAELDTKLQSKHSEVSTYQDMLEQSQGQYIILEKKYYKAKKIIKEYQGRERDFLHREEYHITQLEEKDSHYNALVKALKDRVINLEEELTNAQKKAGLPIQVPDDPDVQPAFLDLQQSAQSALAKLPVKEELDEAVPPHELLDVSASRAKGELAARGGLANRHLPSLKKTTSMSSAGSQEHSLDESSLDDELPEAQKHTAVETAQDTQQEQGSWRSAEPQERSLPPQSPPQQPPSSTPQPPHSSSQIPQNTSINSLNQTKISQPPSYSQATMGSVSYLGSPPPPYQPPPEQFVTPRPPLAPTDLSTGLPSRPLGAATDTLAHDSLSESRPEIPYRHPPPVARVLPVNRAEISESASLAAHLANRTPQQQSLAEQLKALLAEREVQSDGLQRNDREASPNKRSPTSLMEDVRQAVLQADVSSHDVSIGQIVQQFTSPNRSQQSGFYSPSGRDALRETNAGSQSPKLGRSNIHASPMSGVSANPSGVVLLSQRPIDSSLPVQKLGPGVDGSSGDLSSSGPASLGSGDEGSGASLGSQTSLSHSHIPSDRSKRSHMWQTAPVIDWTKEQVSQWLIVQGLENCVNRFQEIGMTGPRLLNLDVRDLKSLGLPADEKSRIKRKVKELRLAVEKERKQVEKEKKERERLQKKAEKLAEKAEKKKK